jgi:uncharacterized phiE125 gp8 family phage protein
MPLELVTAPATEPVTLDEAKAHLKIDSSDDDALITTLIAAARARAEWHTGRAFVTQSWRLWLDAWPCEPVEIPLPPLQSVSTVTVYARDDSATVLDASTYQVASNRIAFKAAQTNLRRLNAVAIAFTAGFGDDADDTPALIRQAILDIIADLYTNRGDTNGEPPLEALALLAPYRVIKL